MNNNVTDVGLSHWHELPELVKKDPCLVAYRKEFELSTKLGRRCSKATLGYERIALENPERFEVVIHQTQKAQSEILESPKKIWLNKIKIGILFAVWLLLSGFLMATHEEEIAAIPMSVSANKTHTYEVGSIFQYNNFELDLTGAFTNQNSSHALTVSVQTQSSNSTEWKAKYQWRVPVALVEPSLFDAILVKSRHHFDLTREKQSAGNSNSTLVRIVMNTNFPNDFAFKLAIDTSPVDKEWGIIYATFILIGLYIFIIWDIVDKTFATLVASTLAIGVLAIVGGRPTLPKIVSWIDIETLFLLFGMMIIIGIMSETGFFDFLAVYAYKITKGRIWPLIYCLCLFTVVLSAFLDNVTCLLLLAPVSIRLCEIMDLNPIPILISMILYSNIGGSLTPVGDPPNIIIISNSYVAKSEITFTNFILHMLIGAILASIQTYFQLRFSYRTIDDLRLDTHQSIDPREQLDTWRHAHDTITSKPSCDDFIKRTVVERVKNLENTVRKQKRSASIPRDCFLATLVELEAKYPIKNRPLLIKSLVALCFALAFFFLHSVPGLNRLSLGWIAFLGAMLLLVVGDKNDMEVILERIEWSTLLLFASLFILVEALGELGLIEWIGNQTENLIVSVDEEWRLAVALLIIIWVSAIASTFLANIPLTTMMIKIVVDLAQNPALGLPLPPMIWALVFGACFGGNGSLIGASANIICAGVAEQHGFKMSFYDYFKIGFPIMIGNIIAATAYIMFAHVLFQWH